MKYYLPEPPDGRLNPLKSCAKKASLHVNHLSRVWRKADTHGVGAVHLDFLLYPLLYSRQLASMNENNAMDNTWPPRFFSHVWLPSRQVLDVYLALRKVFEPLLWPPHIIKCFQVEYQEAIYISHPVEKTKTISRKGSFSPVACCIAL